MSQFLCELVPVLCMHEHGVEVAVSVYIGLCLNIAVFNFIIIFIKRIHEHNFFLIALIKIMLDYKFLKAEVENCKL